MSRAHVGSLLVLAALLVFDGGRASAPISQSGEAAAIFAALPTRDRR